MSVVAKEFPMDVRLQNAVLALKMGMINWFQYFEIVRRIP